MAQWVIEIHSVGDQLEFHRLEQGPPPGAPLSAQVGDTVVWQNRTNAEVVLISTEPAGVLNQTLGPGEPSHGLFVVSGTVKYVCVHPSQTHKIEV